MAKKQRNLTVPGALDLRLDWVTLVGQCTQQQFLESLSDLRVDEKARRFFLPRPSTGGVRVLRYRLLPCGVAVDIPGECLRSLSFDEQAEFVLAVVLVCFRDVRVTMPRLDWAVQLDNEGSRTPIERAEILASAERGGLLVPGLLRRSNVPVRVESLSGSTDYRERVKYSKRKSANGGTIVSKDRWLLRVYDARCRGESYLRVEVQENFASREFVDVRSLALSAVTCGFLVPLSPLGSVVPSVDVVDRAAARRQSQAKRALSVLVGLIRDESRSAGVLPQYQALGELLYAVARQFKLSYPDLPRSVTLSTVALVAPSLVRQPGLFELFKA